MPFLEYDMYYTKHTITIKQHANKMDCPICLEIVDQKRNCVITECGHCFHTSCLMTNVMHNGFGCPYCRDVMTKVEQTDEHEDDEDEDDESEYDSEEDDEEDDQEDYVLRGFRFFYNNIENTEHDTSDVFIETTDQVSEEINPDRIIPSNKYMIEKLQEKNVTYGQLVAMIVDNHYRCDDDELGTMDNVYGVLNKINDIIIDYN